jgi:hypothetical protein
MNKLISMVPLLLSFMLLAATAAGAVELTGEISAETKFFTNRAIHGGQEDNSASVALRLEFYHEAANGSSFTFTPFARYDSADRERTHFDIRELNYLWLGEGWELRAGISKVFWGVTEFVHLVDIINQDDMVESPDREDKLGQPMVHLSVPSDWGTLDLFVLPYFRERTFPGKGGRLRSAVIVDTDKAIYESSDEERHLDYAARYSHSIGDLDFGIYHFKGTGREPTLQLDLTSGSPVLVPYYEQIGQSGFDAHLVAGQWLLKFEDIYRTGQGEGFYSGTGGFEYTFTGIGQSAADIGIIMEYVNDSRGKDATTAFNNDLITGIRLAFNDQASTELLGGYVEDLDNHSRIVSIEASRRIGNSIKATLETRSFVNIHKDDLIYDIRDDDYLLFELTYYF